MKGLNVYYYYNVTIVLVNNIDILYFTFLKRNRGFARDHAVGIAICEVEKQNLCCYIESLHPHNRNVYCMAYLASSSVFKIKNL